MHKRAIGARLLGEIYSITPHSGKPDLNALMSTFSTYNSGTFTTGLKNGYASTVMSNAHRSELALVVVPQIRDAVRPEFGLRDEGITAPIATLYGEPDAS